MSTPTLDGIKFEYQDQGQIPSIVSHLYRRHEDGRWKLLTQADLDSDSVELNQDEIKCLLTACRYAQEITMGHVSTTIAQLAAMLRMAESVVISRRRPNVPEISE